MPPAIGAGEDEDMGVREQAGSGGQTKPDFWWVGNETEEERQARYAKEAEDAKKWFEEVDKTVSCCCSYQCLHVRVFGVRSRRSAW